MELHEFGFQPFKLLAANIQSRRFNLHAFWKLTVSATVERSAGRGFSDAAPLLEEEGDASRPALCADAAHPRRFHRAGAWSTFTANNNPTDAFEVNWTEVLQEWLDREEANFG